MAWRQHIDFSPIPFVKAKTSDDDWFSAGCPLESAPQQQKVTGGTEVKAFYEDLVGISADDDITNSSGTNSECKQQQKHQPSNQEQTNKQVTAAASQSKKGNLYIAHAKHTVNNYLRAAQNGDTKCISCMLASGMDINVQDQYKWTALMCAAEAGQSEVIKLLLGNGADKSLVNSSGNTALDIAKHGHRSYIVRLLDSSDRGGMHAEKNAKSSSPFYCKVCKANFSDTNETAHSTSTIHLFNMKLKPKRTMYQISESNRGFQMMLRSGWNEESGLGKEGKGQRFPVRTVLKRDRHGLGCGEKSKPKITHFAANDMKAIEQLPNPNREMRVKTLGKRAQIKAVNKQRQKEIQFRREFYDE